MPGQSSDEKEEEEQSRDWLFGGETEDDRGFNYMEPWNYGDSHEEYEGGAQGHLQDDAGAREPVNSSEEGPFNLTRGEDDPTPGPVRAERSWRLQAADATYFVGLCEGLYPSTELNEAVLLDGLNDPDLFDGLEEYVKQLNGDGFQEDGRDTEQGSDAKGYPDDEMTDLTQDEEPEHRSIAVHGASVEDGDDSAMVDVEEYDLNEMLDGNGLQSQESDASLQQGPEGERQDGQNANEMETDSFTNPGTSMEDRSTPAGESSHAAVVPLPGSRYVCDHPGCEKSFALPGELRHHQRYHTPSKQREYVCPDHPRTRFLFAHELTRHMAGPQHQARQYICTSCRKPLSRKDSRHWKSKSCSGPPGGSIVLISDLK